MILILRFAICCQEKVFHSKTSSNFYLYIMLKQKSHKSKQKEKIGKTDLNLQFKVYVLFKCCIVPWMKRYRKVSTYCAYLLYFKPQVSLVVRVFFLQIFDKILTAEQFENQHLIDLSVLMFFLQSILIKITMQWNKRFCLFVTWSLSSEVKETPKKLCLCLASSKHHKKKGSLWFFVDRWIEN